MYICVCVHVCVCMCVCVFVCVPVSQEAVYEVVVCSDSDKVHLSQVTVDGEFCNCID